MSRRAPDLEGGAKKVDAEVKKIVDKGYERDNSLDIFD